MIQLLKHNELNLVAAASGSCLPSFSLSNLGDSCATSGATGYSVTVKFTGGSIDSKCVLRCQGQNMGYFTSGMSASCMPGQMLSIDKMGGSGPCSGNAGYTET